MMPNTPRADPAHFRSSQPRAAGGPRVGQHSSAVSSKAPGRERFTLTLISLCTHLLDNLAHPSLYSLLSSVTVTVKSVHPAAYLLLWILD